MSIAALSTAGFSQYINSSSNVAASQKALQSLQQSLTSGNLSAAKTAFNAFMQLNPSQAASGSSSSSSATQLSNDLATLGSAIGAGNLTNAQSAFTTVQSDLKATPSQAMTNAEGAVAQTVQWVDDLLSLASPSDAPTTTIDPATSILDSAYGLNPSSTDTNPTTTLLENAYGKQSSGDSTSSATAATPTASSGNAGNAASVNAYA